MEVRNSHSSLTIGTYNKVIILTVNNIEVKEKVDGDVVQVEDGGEECTSADYVAKLVEDGKVAGRKALL